MTATVAALFVDPRGPYWGREDVDAWDEERDALKYTGQLPVVAHPPCARWCRMSRFVASRQPNLRVGDDGGAFNFALSMVETYGGVLEQPAWSYAWAAHDLIAPNRGGWCKTITHPHQCRDAWVCEVNQAAYGHEATKATWLLYVGRNPPAPMNRSNATGSKVVSGMRNRCRRPTTERLWSRSSHLTPPAFADALVELAKNCGGAP